MKLLCVSFLAWWRRYKPQTASTEFFCTSRPSGTNCRSVYLALPSSKLIQRTTFTINSTGCEVD